MSFKWFEVACDTLVNTNEQLPVSVVLVVIKSRLEFVNAFVLPSIQANNPAEIIVVDDEDLTNQEKRNKGASLATQKYLFVCDDDVVMPSNHLALLCKALDKDDKVAFAYTDYQAVVMDPITHPKGANYYQKSKDFDLESLKFSNYIDTCSLVRKELFPGFDPDIKRFQDWDLWLTITLRGHEGVYVKETGIIKYYLDEGITSKKTSIEISKNIVLKKHGLSGLLCVLFVDTGKGFNPGESIAKELQTHGDLFEVLFDLEAYPYIRKLRFDPVEGKCCTVILNQITCEADGKTRVIENIDVVNGIRQRENHFFFSSTDPQLRFQTEGVAKQVRVSGRIVLGEPKVRPASFFKRCAAALRDRLRAQ
jgi:hypothetical protein